MILKDEFQQTRVRASFSFSSESPEEKGKARMFQNKVLAVAFSETGLLGPYQLGFTFYTNHFS